MFFDRCWRFIGDKKSLQGELTSRTKINKEYGSHEKKVGHAFVGERMSWMAGRQTTVPEDTAYCLLGLFGANMPLLYGEGRRRAFQRLQEEIMRYSDDHTMFLWQSGPGDHDNTGLLASHPDQFSEAGRYRRITEDRNTKLYQMTNKGVAIDLPCQYYKASKGRGRIAVLECCDENGCRVAIFLDWIPGVYNQHYRTWTAEVFTLHSKNHRTELKHATAENLYITTPYIITW